MLSMVSVALQWVAYEHCTAKSFTEKLFRDPAKHPTCQALGSFASSSWGKETWDEIARWAQGLLSA